MATLQGVSRKNSKILKLGKGIRRNYLTMVGFLIVIVFLLMALFGPLFTPYHFAEQSIANRLQSPSAEHIFGTDEFGRDIFTRVVVGSRNVCVVAGLGAMLSVLVGLLLGLIAGYWGGLIDEIITRSLEVLMAIPALLLAMLVLFSLGSTFYSVILVVGLSFTPAVTRVVRSVVLDVRTRSYVEAARLRGESTFYILVREILPAVLPHLAVEASMRFVFAIFMVASLGFLGLGIQPPAPDWGYMVSEARPFLTNSPWALFFPAMAIAILVVGVSFMSDGLRKMLLPGGVSING